MSKELLLSFRKLLKLSHNTNAQKNDSIQRGAVTGGLRSCQRPQLQRNTRKQWMAAEEHTIPDEHENRKQRAEEERVPQDRTGDFSTLARS